MSTIPTNRESDRFMLRLPDGMRDRIKAAAEANNRSMNAEIVATLEKQYPVPLDERVRALVAISLEMEGISERMESASPGEERDRLIDELVQLSHKLSQLRRRHQAHPNLAMGSGITPSSEHIGISALIGKMMGSTPIDDGDAMGSRPKRRPTDKD